MLMRQDKTPAASTSFSPRLLANHPLMHIALLALLIIIIYSNTLNVPFDWDDDTWLVRNPLVKDLHYFFGLSTPKGIDPYLYSSFIYRYIGYLTFALNYKFNGLSLAGYHIVNIAIHIANSILVFFLVLLTFKTPFFVGYERNGSTASRHSQGSSPINELTHSPIYSSIAFFSALLFAVHPLQTEVVTNVYQRFASLAAFCYILSLITYIKSRLSEDKLRRLFYYGICLISAILAMKTKENAFTLPIIIVLYEFCFFNIPSVSPLPHLNSSPSSSPSCLGAFASSQRLLYLIPLLLTLTIIPLTYISVPGVHQIYLSVRGGARNFSRWEYFFTQFRVVVTYLRMLFFPVKLNIAYEYPVFRSFFEPQVMLSFVFLSFLFGTGIYLLWKAKSIEHRAHRLLGFGILWFFITLSVESSVIPLTELINGYRVYLPSVGIIITVVAGVFVLQRFLLSRFTFCDLRLILIMFVIVTGVLSFRIYGMRRTETGLEYWKIPQKDILRGQMCIIIWAIFMRSKT